MTQDIDLPPPRTIYPFAELEVNQSFLIDCLNEERLEVGKRARSAAYNFGRRHGSKFIARVVDGGVRVWRVA
jgi:hypothetical protein